jgi:UDP-N-acetylmuramate dehydrogenase
MIKKRVDLSFLTTIHQMGHIDLNIIESKNDLGSFNGGYFIGAGSNILIKNFDEEFYKLSDNFSYMKIEDGVLICGAASRISKVLNFQIKHSISSLEFLAGVPATIGGVVYMNAGAFDNTIADKVAYAKLFCKENGIFYVTRDEIELGYRQSNIGGCVVLEAGFDFKKTDRAGLIKNIKKNINTRLTKSHLNNTFGSVFKNGNQYNAGTLIENVGLRGFRKNSAYISDKHANFIIGSQETDVKDVFYLMDEAKNRVYNSFGIELEEEVKIL